MSKEKQFTLYIIRLFKNKWQEAVNDLMEQVQLEGMSIDEQSNTPSYKRSVYEQFQFFAQLYIKYIDIYKKLEDCYDNMVHPQKRKLLKNMLENTMVRMCETKRALVQTNTHSNSYQADFVNLDELIMDLKLTSDSLEVPIPRYFRREEDFRRLDERNQIVDKLLVDFHETSAPEEEIIVDKPLLEVNIEIMICLIQKNERGRQGIERANLVKLLRKQEIKKQEKQKKIQEGMVIAEETEREDSALVLQKYWRGYKGRESVHRLREEEFLFLGMKRVNEDPKDPLSQMAKAQQQHQKLVMIQAEHQKEYEMALDNLKSLVNRNEGPEIKERKIRERKEWIEQYLDKTENKKLPEKAIYYHDKEKMFPLSAEEQEALAKKANDKKAPTTKDKKKDKNSQEEEKKESLLSMEILMQLNHQIESYQKTWGSINEADNFQQKYVTEVAMAEKRPEVEVEIDSLVDELIEIELDNRHLFLFGKNRKKPKTKNPKPKKPKKKKIPGMNLVKGRNPLDLLSELVEAGIVKKLMPAQLSDLKGDQNVLGCVQERQYEIMPDPSFAQLRQILCEYIAIPLGSSYAKEKLEKMTYFLFFGPQGTGKTLAVRALAHECNAMVVDLSPSNIENKVTDKQSIAKTFYMAFTVAKEFQPAVIYMDEIHQIFGTAKKKKGAASAQWTKLKKPLQDFKKSKYLEPIDRVVFIGCTNRPLECGMKDTRSFFEKKLFFPIPNYATRQLLFKMFIEQKGIQLPVNFPINTLAHITAEYPAGSFKNIIDMVVTPKRIERMKEEPLKLAEFLPPLSKSFFTFKDDYEKIRLFMDEVTGIRDRRESERNNQNADNKKTNKKVVKK